MAEDNISVVNTFTKAEFIYALDMAQYERFNERVIIKNGNFVVDLKAIDVHSHWSETIERERTKAIKRMLKRVRRANQSLFKVEKEKKNV